MKIKDKTELKVEAIKPSDFDLAQKAAAGDVAAFEELYWKHHRRVFSVCLRMTKNVAEAEDVTQKVFLLLFRKIGSFRGDSAFSTWLHRMTVNTTLMHFRKNKTIKEYTTKDGILPDKSYSDNKNYSKSHPVDSIDLTRAISELPDGYRRVFILHDIQGYQHNEIAQMLGCADGTSKSQLFKARRRLHKLMTAKNKIPTQSLMEEF